MLTGLVEVKESRATPHPKADSKGIEPVPRRGSMQDARFWPVPAGSKASGVGLTRPRSIAAHLPGRDAEPCQGARQEPVEERLPGNAAFVGEAAGVADKSPANVRMSLVSLFERVLELAKSQRLRIG